MNILTCKIVSLCYNIITKGNRHRVVDQIIGNKSLPTTRQSTGKVFAMLVTYQVNECQQCYDKHSKRH